MDSLASPASARNPLVADGEALLFVLRLLDLVEDCHREILRGNAALALAVLQKLLGPRAVAARARSWLDDGRRTYGRPIKSRETRLAKNVERVAMCERESLPLLRKIRRIDELQSRRDLEASRAIHVDQTDRFDAREPFHKSVRRFHHQIRIAAARTVGADHHVVVDCGVG